MRVELVLICLTTVFLVLTPNCCLSSNSVILPQKNNSNIVYPNVKTFEEPFREVRKKSKFALKDKIGSGTIKLEKIERDVDEMKLCLRICSNLNQFDLLEKNVCQAFSYCNSTKECIVFIEKLTITDNNEQKRADIENYFNFNELDNDSEDCAIYKRTYASSINGPVEILRPLEYHKNKNVTQEKWIVIPNQNDFPEQFCSEKCDKNTKEDEICLTFEFCTSQADEQNQFCALLVATNDKLNFASLTRHNEIRNEIFLRDFPNQYKPLACFVSMKTYFTSDFSKITLSSLIGRKNDFFADYLTSERFNSHENGIETCAQHCSFNEACHFFKFTHHFEDFNELSQPEKPYKFVQTCTMYALSPNNTPEKIDKIKRFRLDDLECAHSDKSDQICVFYAKKNNHLNFSNQRKEVSSVSLIVFGILVFIFWVLLAIVGVVILLKKKKKFAKKESEDATSDNGRQSAVELSQITKI